MDTAKNFDFDSLRQKLEESGEFPRVFLFKFIVPSDNRSIALAEALFDDQAQVSLRSSRNGKYTSISAKELMLSAEAIIDRYRSALQIDGLIAL